MAEDTNAVEFAYQVLALERVRDKSKPMPMLGIERMDAPIFTSIEWCDVVRMAQEVVNDHNAGLEKAFNG